MLLTIGTAAILVGLIVTQFENVRKIAWLESAIGGWSNWKIIVAVVIVGQALGLKGFWLHLFAQLPVWAQQQLIVLGASLVAIGMMGVIHRAAGKVTVVEPPVAPKTLPTPAETMPKA